MPIEVVPGSPAENVLMVKAPGKLTGDDYTKQRGPPLAAPAFGAGVESLDVALFEKAAPPGLSYNGD